MPITLDQFVLGLLASAVREYLEPKCNGVPIWDNGGRVIAEGVVRAAGVPQLTGDEIAARALAAVGIGRSRVTAKPLCKCGRRANVRFDDGQVLCFLCVGKLAGAGALSGKQGTVINETLSSNQGPTIDVTGGPVS